MKLKYVLMAFLILAWFLMALVGVVVLDDSFEWGWSHAQQSLVTVAVFGVGYWVGVFILRVMTSLYHCLKKDGWTGD